MMESRFRDIKWWYWLATAILLVVCLVAGWRQAIYVAIALTAFQIIQFAAREHDLTAFPIQVRTAYLGLLVIGLYPWLAFVHWIQLCGTWGMVVVGYCPLARMLSLLPWNRRQRLSISLVRRTFLSWPVPGSIIAAVNAAVAGVE